MADTKESREKQANDDERRQREREVAEARARGDESEPSRETVDGPDDTRRMIEGDGIQPHRCHRRGCEERATFTVLERYQEETGHGPVEATALLCRDHADEESPTNLDAAYEDYVFRVEPLPPTSDSDAA